MGSLLTVTFSLLSKGARTLVNRGVYYCIIYIISYSYLWLSHYFKKRRLDLYDVHAKNDVEKLAFLVPKEEWALETHQKETFLAENADDSSCFGVNSSSEFLFLHISRNPISQVHCSLLLRLNNGKVYMLPEEHVIQKESGEFCTFGSARIKMECLLPMRRWRIFFNGTLWEKTGNDDDGTQLELKHVKFALLWIPSSFIFDYKTDFSIPLLAHATAFQKNRMINPISFMKKVIKICDGYSQSGMFSGTVEIEGQPAREIYLWGNKSRFLGQNTDLEDGRFVEFYVNAENGVFIYLRALNVPGTITDYRYGYVMQANGFLNPIDECHMQSKENSEEIVCHSGGFIYKINIESENVGYNFQNHFQGETYTKAVNVQVNGMEGRGIKSVGTIGKKRKAPRVSEIHNYSIQSEGADLTLPIADPRCQNSHLTGGKGSSLAVLHAVSKKFRNDSALTDTMFHVPKGLVVTTAAYEKFIAGSLKNSLSRFERTVWADKTENYSSLCESIMKDVVNTDLPDSVVKSVEHSLRKVFGSGFSETRFAVRSSATGEDTELLSAAGQMETFLGIRGFNEILKALKKCWASQFSFVAVQYKRRYGQLLNTPMAVVIQEMIPCDSAGVLFTCDPVSGNPAYVTISANYGLGESVVAASAEPDTITLKRTLKDELNIHSMQVGGKKTKVIMTPSDGVQSVDLKSEESSGCCLSDDMCLKLAKVAVKVEAQYGSPRDIEWGILSNQVFLLQARPITSITTETEFELKHCYDSYLRREDEYTSKANVGEVLCGSTSPLGLDLMLKIACITYPRYKYMEELISETNFVSPYFPTGIVVVAGHVFFSLCDSFFRFGESEGKTSSSYSKAMSVALLGRVLEDEKLFQIAKDRHYTSKKKLSLTTRLIIIPMMFFAGYRNRFVRKRLSKYKIPIKKDTANDIFATIIHHLQDYNTSMVSHLECTLSSSFWNLPTLALLAEEEGDYDNNVFSDFAYLLSSCTDVESADVPSTIQRLVYTISKCIKPSEFKKMTIEEALQWLSSTSSDAGTEFRDFLARHGHRGIREFDIYTHTWDMDAKPLVEMLQGCVSEHSVAEKKPEHTGVSFSHLKVKLSFFSSLWLRFLLRNCRRCVRERECSKSVIIKQLHSMREATRTLAKAMVREGRLPNEESLYFLCFEEIHQLLQTRSPKLVSLAIRRWKCHPELDKLIFPEMCIGIPKPFNMAEEIPVSDDDLTMTGVPVSQGVVTARACVILSIREASSIQPGDVLITYSTDIGWSPYFPLLSGVVTELGGLVSHGAVVAREYGLPCVVNLHGAVRVFKTGDLVQLDGNKGVLRRIKRTEQISEL